MANMISTRGACFICRVQRHGVEGLLERKKRTSRKFSSISKEVRSPQSGQARSTVFAARQNSTNLFSARVRLLPRNRPITATYIPQARFQSTIQNVSDAASNILGDPASSPELSSDAVSAMEPVLDTVKAGETWHFGFLREHGLDFGYGPTSMMQWLFEHIYIWSDLSFGASIVALAITWRLALFPLSATASEQSARMQKMQHFMPGFKAKYAKARASEDQAEMLRAKREYQQEMKKLGVQPWKMAGPFLQIPLGFGSWRLIRNMAWLQAPGMATGGFFWFPNLMLHDPFFVLPLATAVCNHLAVRFNTNAQNNMSPTIQNLMLWGLPGMMFVFIAGAPAGVQLSFCTGAFCALATNLTLRSNTCRAMLGLTPRNTPPPPPPGEDYKGTITIEKNVRDRALGKQAKAVDSHQTSSTSAKALIKRVANKMRNFSFRRFAESTDTSTGFSPFGMSGKDQIGNFEKKQRAQRDNELTRKRNRERQAQRKRWEEEDRQKYG